MRGYQKKVIYMKNPGSAFFEEAYFVIKDGATQTSERSIVEEANRIIKENTSPIKERTHMPTALKNSLLFFAGFFASALIMALLLLLL